MDKFLLNPDQLAAQSAALAVGKKTRQFQQEALGVLESLRAEEKSAFGHMLCQHNEFVARVRDGLPFTLLTRLPLRDTGSHRQMLEEGKRRGWKVTGVSKQDITDRLNFYDKL